MMTRSQKNEVISDLKEKISNANGIFLTNLIGVDANYSVSIRKKVRDAEGTIIITRNTLFEKASEGTYAEGLLKGLKGTNAVAFAFGEVPAVAKVINDASEENELVKLGKGFLGQDELTESEVKSLAKLPSRDQMLGTLLATFNAPVSAFARLINSLKDEVETKGVSNPSELETEKSE